MTRKALLRFPLCALFALALAACGSATSNEPLEPSDGDNENAIEDADTGEREADAAATTLTVHAYSDFQPYLYYSQDGALTWVTYPGLKMGDEGTGWYVAAKVDCGKSGELHFVFNDGAGTQSAARWIKPKGRENEKDAHFIVAAGEVWVKGGELYVQSPDLDGDTTESVEGETADGEIPETEVTDGDSGESETTVESDTTDHDTTDNDTTDTLDTTDTTDSPDADTTDGDTTDTEPVDADTSDPDLAEPDSVENVETDLDVEQPPVQYAFTVHLYSSWTSAKLRYQVDPDGTNAELGMVRDNKGWLTATAYISWSDTLHFNPVGPNGVIVTPTGSSAPFQTKAAEVWIADGGALETSEPEVASYTVHFYSADWYQPYLYYSPDGSGTKWTPDGGEAMVVESTNWFKLSVALPKGTHLFFLFNNGANLNDSQNWYHPYGHPNDNFSSESVTDAREMWVKGGLLTNSPPAR